MTTETQQSEGDANKGEGSTVDVKAIQERLAQLESSNQRLLAESQDYKKKYSETKSTLEEQAKKAIDGDVAKQLEYERKQREKYESEVKTLRTGNLKNAVRNAVAEYAKDAHNIDDVMNQPEFSHILAAGVNQETGTVDKSFVKDFVNKVYEAKPYLKKNINQATVDTSKASGASAASGKSLKSMTTQELDNLING